MAATDHSDSKVEPRLGTERASYRSGFVFGTLSFFGVAVAGEHRFRYRGNWKIQLENTTDAYHFPIVHKSFITHLSVTLDQT